MPRLPNSADVQKQKMQPRKASQVLAKFKELASFMTDRTYPDGSEIGDVQLTLRTRGPVILAQIKLGGQGGLRVQVEDTCVDEVLMALEAALQANPVPWEPDPFPLNAAVRKKK